MENGTNYKYLQKRNRNECKNYRGIALLPTCYKLYTSILKTKLQPIAEGLLLEEQCDFRKGRSCIDAIFTLKQIMEKKREFNEPFVFRL